MSSANYRFLNTIVIIRVSHKDSPDGLSVLEHHVALGDSPPLHIHEREDEVFHVLEGRMRMQVGNHLREVGPGEILVVPQGTPHTYRVVSPTGARFITVTAHEDFERLVCELGEETLDLRLDSSPAAPSPELIDQLIATAAKYHIRMVGPPLGPVEDVLI